MVVLLIQIHLAFADAVSVVPSCVDFHQAVTNSLDALWTGSVSDMRHHMESSEQRLTCLEPLSRDSIREDLGHLYLLKAYDAHLKEDSTERTWWLQQSVQVEYWDPNFGPEIEAFRDELEVSKPVVLSLLPTGIRENVTVWVDGHLLSDVLEVQQGMHWIEVYDVDTTETPVYVEFVRVQEGTFLKLPERIKPMVQEGMSIEKSRNRLWLSSTMLWSAIGLSSHTMAMMNYEMYPQSASLVELEQRRTQTWRWGQVSLGSATIAGISMGLWLFDVDREKQDDSMDIDNAGLSEVVN